ncbi:MAG: hypothetical protein WC785_02790 [Tatlockia sp.]|jgi:hypothetical protein
MKKNGLLIALSLFSAIGFAQEAIVSEAPEPVVIKNENTIAMDATEAYWVFSGLVTTENGERFNYYFQMQRKDQLFQSLAMLIDSQTSEVLLFARNVTVLAHPDETNWRVGDSFMHFNPINNSWVFGVKAKGHKGFNFKVDMLGQSQNSTTRQNLRSGIELLVNQTGHLNGHIQTGEGEKEQFVTAQKAWFKQIWVSQNQQASHPLMTVLCQFHDGSGFYAANLQESDALRGAIAGWRDMQGSVSPMSQFVSMKEAKEGEWQIAIPSPKVNLTLEDALAKENDKHQLIAGMTKGEMPGFCTISKDEIGVPIS